MFKTEHQVYQFYQNKDDIGMPMHKIFGRNTVPTCSPIFFNFPIMDSTSLTEKLAQRGTFCSRIMLFAAIERLHLSRVRANNALELGEQAV